MLDCSWNFRWKREICWEPHNSLFLLYANKKFDTFYPSPENLRESEVNDYRLTWEKISKKFRFQTVAWS